MAKVYEFLANGFEEIEGLAPVDILRRGGVDIKTVSGTGTKLIVVIAEGGFSEMIHLLFYRLTLIHGEPLLYSCQQLFRIEGLGKIIVCLQGETFQSIVLLRPGKPSVG